MADLESPSKKRRTGYANGSSSQPDPAIHQAKKLEHRIAIQEQLSRLQQGRACRQELSWSRHNLIAHASSTSLIRPSAPAHLVVRTLRSTVPGQSHRPTPQPCLLYPPSPFLEHPTTNVAGPSRLSNQSSSQYDDPKCIEFSPCGFYLCAFFPLRNRALAKVKSSPSVPQGENSVNLSALPIPNDQSREGVSSQGDPVSTTGTHNGVPSDAALAHSTSQFQAPSNSLSLDLHQNDDPVGKFCIWSRADSGALNDWKLVHSVSIREGSGRKAGTKPNTANVLKVDRQGQQVHQEANGPSSDNKDSISALPVLQGGILHVMWLNRKRSSVMSASASTSASSAFSRLASRGPSFSPASDTDHRPDQDLALLLFGKQGQVTLFHSRKCDREAGPASTRSSSATSSPPPSKGSNLFRLLTSSLYVPDLQPAPVTLDLESNDEQDQPMEGSLYTSLFADEESDISHLAVGMPADENFLLVASKRSPQISSCVDLTEIVIDLKAETISMITRPVQTISLDTAGSDMESKADDTETGIAPHQQLTGLSWAEIEDENPRPSTDKMESLQLLACFSNGPISDSNPLDLDSQDDGHQFSSLIQVWEVGRAGNELSDAFSSLECRKTGHAPKWLDWQLKLNRNIPIVGKAITSLQGHAGRLPTKNVALVTALNSADGPDGSVLEQMFYLDLTTMELVSLPSSDAAVPVHALCRCSTPSISPNGVLVATLSQVPFGTLGKKLIIWKLPLTSHLADGDKVAIDKRFSQLVTLSEIRNTDAMDVTRAFPAMASDMYREALIEVSDLLRITDSKRKDIIKLESGGQATASASGINIAHIMRLLQLRLAMGWYADEGTGRTRLERLVLELGLCYQMLRLSRVKTEAHQDLNPVDKKKPKATPLPRVYYRLDSVWSILAQLQWLLSLLDGIGKLAMMPTPSSSTLDTAFEQDFVQMLTVPTPRRLVLQTLAHFCDFKDWLLSTTKKENLPAPNVAREGRGGIGKFSYEAFDFGSVAVSEQMELARDSLRHVLVSSSVDLDEFTRVLASLDQEAASKDQNAFWWAELSASKTRSTNSKVGDQSNDVPKSGLGPQGLKLLSSITSAETGALVDVLTLFLSPSDLLDERSVLHDNVSLPLPSADLGRGQEARDVIRKVLIKNAVTQGSLQQMMATGSIPAGTHMRAKFCLRCFGLSQDAVKVSYTAAGGANGGLDPNLPPQMQIQQMPMQTMVGNVEVKSGKASTFEERFKYHCLCGGGWWVL